MSSARQNPASQVSFIFIVSIIECNLLAFLAEYGHQRLDSPGRVEKQFSIFGDIDCIHRICENNRPAMSIEDFNAYFAALSAAQRV